MSRMYSERVGNISAVRGCSHFCSYCAFRTSLRRSSCVKCRSFEIHTHVEVLKRNPPRTKDNEFLTVGLTGDISFASDEVIRLIIAYCAQWSDRTFLLQSKNPARFIETDGTGTQKFYFPSNVILGCTLETNYSLIPSASAEGEYVLYNTISKAPDPVLRVEAMEKIRDNRKIVTIEPVLNFDPETLKYMIEAINPMAVYIGYDSGGHKLPESPLQKTLDFIESIKATTQVRQKLMRPAWFEQSVRTDA